MVHFGARIRAARRERKLTQEEFGALAGISKKTQMLYERGHRSPDMNYLAALAEHGVDIGFIATGRKVADDIREAEANQLAYLGVQEYAKKYWRESGLEEPPPPVYITGSVAEREAELLFNFRMATEDGKAAIEATARAVQKTTNKNEEAK